MMNANSLKMSGIALSHYKLSDQLVVAQTRISKTVLQENSVRT
jgi:hypothetical protein